MKSSTKYFAPALSLDPTLYNRVVTRMCDEMNKLITFNLHIFKKKLIVFTFCLLNSNCALVSKLALGLKQKHADRLSEL